MILALECSAKAASCALMKDGILLGEAFVNNGLTHSQTLMPLVEGLLKQSGVGLEEADRLAVSVGPGSFTGLRIGIACAKGLAMGLGKPCVGVSSLEGLAYNLEGFEGILVPAMDARRGQVYTAIFQSDGRSITRLADDMAISIQELGQRLEDYEGQTIWLAGDGGLLCFQELGGSVRLAPEHLRHQRASSVARVARTLEPVSAGELKPIYLRLPQAEREYLEKQQGGPL